MQVPTRQEMFNRAVRGLHSQGWAISKSNIWCKYMHTTPQGQVLRCAWGWIDVDTRLPEGATLTELRRRGLGLARDLVDSDLQWALELQETHDRCFDATDGGIFLRESLSDFAIRHGLAWPEDVPHE